MTSADDVEARVDFAGIQAPSSREAGYAVALKCLQVQADAEARDPLLRTAQRVVLHEDAWPWYAGALGEIEVGEMLKALGPEWFVRHSVPIGTGTKDVDHLVIGPGGVFAINTKHHRDASIWVGDYVLRVNNANTPHLKIAQSDTRDVARRLATKVGFPVPATSVIAVLNANSIVDRRAPDNRPVSVVDAKRLTAWLVAKPRQLNDTKLALIKLAAEEPETWHIDPRAADTLRVMQRFDRLAAQVATPSAPTRSPRRIRATPRRAPARNTERHRKLHRTTQSAAKDRGYTARTLLTTQTTCDTYPVSERIFMADKRKLVTSPVFDSYWRLAHERQLIFHARSRGLPGPWTDNPILSAYRFTNAYRAADRVSQRLIDVVYSGSQEPEDLFFRALLFRIFNKTTTWDALENALGEVSWSEFNFGVASKTLHQLMAVGERVYSAAYIMPSPAFGAERKHDNHLLLLEWMMKHDLPATVQGASSLKDVYEILRSVPSFGPFLAFQMTIDLNYSSLIDFDENDFVVAGPGALSGIKKCFVDAGGLGPEDVIRWMCDTQRSHFSRLGLPFQNLYGRDLKLIDCQNLFCETDKYARVAHPDAAGIGNRTKIKQHYDDSTPTPARRLSFPPKWNLGLTGEPEAPNVLADESSEDSRAQQRRARHHQAA